MGNTCAPCAPDDLKLEMEQGNMDQARPTGKFTEMVNSYQAEYERLKKEVEELRQKEAEEKHNKQAMRSHEIKEEVSATRARLESKEQEIIGHQLIAALHSKAISMAETESITKALKAGHVEKFGRASKSSAKPMWVELTFHSADPTECSVNKAYLMLTYSSIMGSQLVKRCRVVRLGKDNETQSSFSAFVIMSRAEREVVFTCKDDQTRDSWVQAFQEGLKEVELDWHKHKTVNGYTVLELEFWKSTLGIRVEEKVNKNDEETKLADLDVESKTQVAHGNPCDLEVTAVNDESLFESGLTRNYIVSAINGQNMRGVNYFKQVEHLHNTKRPFTLTFLRNTEVNQIAHSGILEKLLAEGDNAVKAAFYDLVEGHEFAKELDESHDKATTIADLLADQSRLIALLQNTSIDPVEI